MDDFFLEFLNFAKKPAIIETFVDILLCSVPIWLAVMIGLVIGWAWRPRWTGLVFLGLRPKLRFVWTFPPGFGARRLWLACTALSAFSVASRLWSNFRLSRRKSSAASATVDSALDSAQSLNSTVGDVRLITETSTEEHALVTKSDLGHLLHLLDGKGWGTPWQYLMEHSTSNMAYQAWQHDPKNGVIYKSRTIFEDATPELVRDFFWDDEFRPKWDPMLGYFKILDECTRTGTTIVHWIKKFPFFCSDREYIIGRRIWEDGNTYYCVTKAVPYPALPKRDKPRRVDMYFSSWVIKPVQSRKGDGQLTACEVTLVHHEDMGIPKDVAKLGVRHGMWGTVKKLHGGFRAYQLARKSEAPLSRSAQLARITTNISIDGSASSTDSMSSREDGHSLANVEIEGGQGGIDWKWLAVGGAVALACGLHTGVIGKAVLFGAGQRIARGRRGAARR